MTTIKDLNEAIQTARRHVILDIPMAQADAVKMGTFFTMSVDTAATDGKSIAFNPMFIASIDEEEREFVVAHEWSHKFLKHISRGSKLKLKIKVWTPKHDLILNIAADEETNYFLEKLGFKLVKGSYRDRRFDDMCMEEIFQILLHESEQEESEEESGKGDDSDRDSGEDQEPGTSGDSSDGRQGEEEESGSGEESQQEEGEGDDCDSGNEQSGDGDDEDGDGSEEDPQEKQDGNDRGDLGRSRMDESESVDPKSIEDYKVPDVKTWGQIHIGDKSASDVHECEVEESIEQSNAIAVSKLSGKLPEAIERMIKDTNSKSNIDWISEMSDFISDACGEDSDLTWSRPNKRFASFDIYMPSNSQEGIGEITILRDSSGSMDDQMYELATNECFNLINQASPGKVHIVDFTTDIVSAATYENGIEADGLPCRMSNGGTDVCVGFDWVDRVAPTTTGIIIMSDMEFFRWPEDIGIPVLWVKIPPKQYYYWIFGKPKFGKMITVQ